MDFIQNVDDVKQTLIDNSLFMKSLENCCDGSFQDEIKKLGNEIMNERLEYGGKLMLIKAKQKRIDTNVQHASNQANTVEEFEQIYSQLSATEEKKRINIKQTSEYKEFKRTMEGISDSNASATNAHDDDNVIEVRETGGMAVSMYDPWSKAIMSNPVRNTKCGHHYDRDTVKASLQNGTDVRCPVVGCASKAFIQLQHLQADPALHSKIQEYLAEQQMQESSDEDN
ncbi:E3 SUMO-protein ligase NSE2 [Drosophila grimshawi]|uniref:E3 SUMO-protein ligase NSE2 n=1 Tax=Drosophila grimshawi TaxID=7222 RepID=B4JSM3_DROGR|nr:E3 SUMO-protein ligase NSE2 [Drosophila grimshawi]EDV94763.1 GH22621 [Drosophila grimshawi]